MESIRQILEMDKAAVRRAEEAVERERKLSDESGERRASENNERLSKEKKESESAVKALREKLNERLRESEKLKADKCGEIEKIFAEHREKWAGEIVNRITGG